MGATAVVTPASAMDLDMEAMDTVLAIAVATPPLDTPDLDTAVDTTEDSAMALATAVATPPLDTLVLATAVATTDTDTVTAVDTDTTVKPKVCHDKIFNF